MSTQLALGEFSLNYLHSKRSLLNIFLKIDSNKYSTRVIQLKPAIHSVLQELVEELKYSFTIRLNLQEEIVQISTHPTNMDDSIKIYYRFCFVNAKVFLEDCKKHLELIFAVKYKKSSEI